MNYWVCKLEANVRSLVVRGKTNRFGSRKKPPKQLTIGDRLFLWESSPSRRVVGLAAIRDPEAGKSKGGRNLFRLQYLTDYFALVTAALHDDLLAYIGGILRELGGALRAGNARPDHIHLLCSLPTKLAMADALRLVKTNSSRWVHRDRNYRAFDWQTGYGAFSVSASLAPAVEQYIRDQDRHHRKMTFQEEFIRFLKRNGISDDERYIWS